MPVSAQLSEALAQNLKQRTHFKQTLTDLEKTIAETEERIVKAAQSIVENEIPNLNGRLPSGYAVSTYRVVIINSDKGQTQDEGAAASALLPPAVEIYLDPPEKIMKDQEEDYKHLRKMGQTGLFHKIMSIPNYLVSKIRNPPADASTEAQAIRDQHFIDLMSSYLSNLIGEAKKNDEEGEKFPFSDLYCHLSSISRFCGEQEKKKVISECLRSGEYFKAPWEFLHMDVPEFHDYVGRMYRSIADPEKKSRFKMEALDHYLKPKIERVKARHGIDVIGFYRNEVFDRFGVS